MAVDRLLHHKAAEGLHWWCRSFVGCNKLAVDEFLLGGSPGNKKGLDQVCMECMRLLVEGGNFAVGHMGSHMLQRCWLLTQLQVLQRLEWVGRVQE